MLWSKIFAFDDVKTNEHFYTNVLWERRFFCIASVDIVRRKDRPVAETVTTAKKFDQATHTWHLTRPVLISPGFFVRASYVYLKSRRVQAVPRATPTASRRWRCSCHESSSPNTSSHGDIWPCLPKLEAGLRQGSPLTPVLRPRVGGQWARPYWHMIM